MGTRWTRLDPQSPRNDVGIFISLQTLFEKPLIKTVMFVMLWFPHLQNRPVKDITSLLLKETGLGLGLGGS